MSYRGAPASGWSERLAPTGYEAPRVERMLTPAELEREVLYAGEPTADQDGS